MSREFQVHVDIVELFTVSEDQFNSFNKDREIPLSLKEYVRQRMVPDARVELSFMVDKSWETSLDPICYSRGSIINEVV